MRKFFVKAVAVVLSLVSAVGMVACGDTTDTEKGKTVYVEASLAGWRRQWLDGVAEKYTEKTGVKVEINWDSNLSTQIANTMEINSNMSDLYYVNMSGGGSEFKWNLQGKLESLNDVYERDNGAGKKIVDTIESGFENSGVYDGKRYAAYIGGGYDCLIYNPDILIAAGWKNDDGTCKRFPDTVDELIEMFEMIEKANLTSSNGKKVKPFVYTGQYYSISHLFDAFEAQYGGIEEYNAFYQHSDKTAPNESNYTKKSTKVAFENLKKIMAVNQDGTPKYVLEGAASMSHTDAQTAFLNGYAAVCTTGTWFENEMGQIISGSTTKYEIAAFPLAADENGSYGKAEENLIDTNGEKVPSNMKKYNIKGFAGSPFFIPTKAKNKEGAKDFLAYVLSEESLRYMHEQMGNKLGFNYNTENLELSAWANKIAANDSVTITAVKGSNNPLYLAGALSEFRNEVWTALASTYNYNYETAMNQRLKDAKDGWAEKIELI